MRFLSILVLCAMSVGAMTASSSENYRELEPLFHSALDFFDDLQRTPNGLYRDSYHVNGDPDRNHFISTAAVGVGLMALCLDHATGRDPNAEKKALKTLRCLNGKGSDVQPPRDETGYFMHFFSDRTGKGKSEYSTIDTAIMVVGALFCRNTFSSSEIKVEADALWNSIDWSKALADPEGRKLYMIMDNGKPVETSKTSMFNEYYILSWLISESKNCDLLSISQMPKWKNQGITLLSENRQSPHCSFIIQFPYYMCHPCAMNPEYRGFVTAQARADRRACRRNELWGCGAGATPNNGYLASNYRNNPDNVVSPRIIAGFMPASSQAQEDLLKLYRDPQRLLKTPVGNLLPRFSLDVPEWKPHRIESIDFASMLFGLAGIHPDLGMRWFHEKTKFTFR